MTKLEFKAFIKKMGGTAHYSGNTKKMYLHFPKAVNLRKCFILFWKLAIENPHLPINHINPKRRRAARKANLMLWINSVVCKHAVSIREIKYNWFNVTELELGNIAIPQF
jgi:hypothetical protein